MGEIQKCPICLKNHELYYHGEGWMYYYCNNKQYTCVIQEENVYYECTTEEKEKRRNAIYNFVFNNPRTQDGYYWKFVYTKDDEYFAQLLKSSEKGEFINVHHLMKSYPKNIDEKMDKILLNLDKLNPALGAWFSRIDLEERYLRLFYLETKNTNQEFNGILDYLLELKYIEWGNIIDTSHLFKLTHKARKRIEELKEKKEVNNKIFIAMSFDKSVEYIENAFKEAILAAGYTPDIIKDKEHNNYIMPEIFNAIENAAGVVVDVTKENLGAYYEAGYALGKNKEVIVCCKEGLKPHFDIEEKNMILWKDKEDLIERLKSRILATIQ